MKDNFNKKQFPDTVFCNRGKVLFGEIGMKKIIQLFDRLKLPLPEQPDSFLKGTEGMVIPINRYGVTIRIEAKDTKGEQAKFKADRVNDSPWVSKPIASINASKQSDLKGAIIEICPGCMTTKDRRYMNFLEKELAKENVEFWDLKPGNVGIAPAKTEHFPNGIPVVIDRLGVERKGENSYSMSSPNRIEAEQALDKLYEPLVDKFDECWENPEKIDEFWDKCRDAKKSGVLIDGWNNTESKDLKKSAVSRIAEKYESFIKQHEKMGRKPVAELYKLK